MIVVPGRRPHRPGARGRLHGRPPDGGRRTWRRAPSASTIRSSRSGSRSTRPATEYGYLLPNSTRGERDRRPRGVPAAGFEEKPKPARAEDLVRAMPGVAWNAGMFLWRRRRDPCRARALHRARPDRSSPMVGAPPLLERAYEAIQRRCRSTTRSWRARRADGQVVMASMDVGWSDLGSWTALLAAIGARGEGAVVQAGETVAVDDDDLVVRRVDGRLGVIAPPERGSMTAAQPIARAARVARRDIDARPGAHRALRASGRLSDTTAGAPRAHDDRLRDGRLAGPHRRRVHVRERPPLRRRRRPRTSRTGAQRPRAS